MSNTHLLHKEEKTFGDAAVDGLFQGLTAGLAMALYLVIVGYLTGYAPGVVMGRFGLVEGGTPVIGALSHLATSSIYGVIFGIITKPIAKPFPFSWLAGLIYAAILFLIAEIIILPNTESALDVFSPVHFAVAHGIYGLVLGVIAGREGDH